MWQIKSVNLIILRFKANYWYVTYECHNIQNIGKVQNWAHYLVITKDTEKILKLYQMCVMNSWKRGNVLIKNRCNSIPCTEKGHATKGLVVIIPCTTIEKDLVQKCTIIRSCGVFLPNRLSLNVIFFFNNIKFKKFVHPFYCNIVLFYLNFFCSYSDEEKTFVKKQMEVIEALQGFVFSSLVIDYNLDFIININSAHKNYIYLLHISLYIF